MRCESVGWSDNWVARRKLFYSKSAGNFKMVSQIPQTSGIPTTSQ